MLATSELQPKCAKKARSSLEDREPEANSAAAERESDDESAYEDEAEEDIAFEDFDEESVFEELKENNGESISDSPIKKKKGNKPTTQKTMPESNGQTKYMFKEPDGRLALVYHLESGFDGTFELDGANRKVIKKRVKSNWMYNARTVYERLGLTADNVHVVGLQAEMDKQRKKDVRAMGQDPETYNGEIVIEEEAFALPFEVFPYFIDARGNQTTDVWLDGGDHGDWVFFWLRDSSTRKRATAARINRNRNRPREGGDTNNRPNRSPRNAGLHGGTAFHVDSDSDL